MENYAGTQTHGSYQPSEDQFTKKIEEYTAALPSSAYLGVAIAARAFRSCFS